MRTRLFLFVALLVAGFLLILPRAEAYNVFSPAIPVTVEARNGATFSVQLIMAGFNQNQSIEFEGPQTPGSISAGFNPYVVGNTSYAEPGLSLTLSDVAFGGVATSTVSQILEFANFSNLKSLTFPTFGTAYNVQSLLGQLPALNSLVLGFLYTPPANLAVTNGPPNNPGGQLQGVEQIFSQQIFGYMFSDTDIKTADLDGNGTQEIIFALDNIVYVLNWNGTPYPGFPLTLNQISVTTVSVGNINANPNLEIVVRQGFDITAIGAAGTVLFTRPNPLNSVTGQPFPVILADITGDGRNELMFAEIVGGFPGTGISVDAIDGSTGNDVPGYPVSIATLSGGSILDSFAVRNVDADLALEFVALYRMNLGLTTVAVNVAVFDTVTRATQINFSVPNAPSVISKLLLINMDGDQQSEIAFAAQNPVNGVNAMYLYNADGTAVVNWPQNFPVFNYPVNLVGGDIDNDGVTELGESDPVGGVRFFNPDGSLVGTNTFTPASGSFGDGLRIADVTRDGAVDVLYGRLGPGPSGQFAMTVGGWGNVFPNFANLLGTVFHPFAFPGTPQILTGPTVGDISGFGVEEVVVAASNQILPAYTEIAAYRMATNIGNAFLPTAPQNLAEPYQSLGVNKENTNAVVP